MTTQKNSETKSQTKSKDQLNRYDKTKSYKNSKNNRNKENKKKSSKKHLKHKNNLVKIDISKRIYRDENEKKLKIIIIAILAVFAFISFIVATNTSFSSDEDYLILHFAQHKNLHFIEKTDLSTNILFIEPLISTIYMLGRNMVEYKIIHIAIFLIDI